ncbi:MAG TPA: TA system VapC family ribonuclease toxin [Terriglobales bacterium]|nr:TA system VapC family ribonuclease toxin [Terriglobales bacterium]
MAKYLLDVNVLIALFWPAHESHARVQQWFRHHSHEGWATCPLTQLGFVRIVSNVAFSPDAVRAEDATQLLEENLKRSDHHFWPDDLSFVDALRPVRSLPRGHRQVTDAYLVALALHRKGKLATLDKSLAGMLPGNGSERTMISLID